VRSRCFPAAPAWPGTVGLVELAERQLRRRAAAGGVAPITPSNKLRDPGFARFRADGELHRYAPVVVADLQAASGFAPAPARAERIRAGTRPGRTASDGTPGSSRWLRPGSA